MCLERLGRRDMRRQQVASRRRFTEEANARWITRSLGVKLQTVGIMVAERMQAGPLEHSPSIDDSRLPDADRFRGGHTKV